MEFDRQLEDDERNKMTSIVCPLCGKHTPIGSFDPGTMDDDIYVVEVRGLGRGKGFAVTSVNSALGSDGGQHEDTVSAIADRVLTLAKFLKDQEVITEDQIVEKLSVGAKSVHVVQEEPQDFNEAESQLHEYEDQVEEIVSEVADILGEDATSWDYDENEGTLGQLKYGIEKLANEYEALSSSAYNGS